MSLLNQKKFLFVSLLAVLSLHPQARAEDETIDQEAQQRADANAAKRKAAMEKAKAHGVSAGEINKQVDAGYQDVINQQMGMMDNPMFQKTPEELKAMGMNEKQIADIQKGKAAMPGYKKKLEGMNKLTQEAVADPESARVKSVDKAAAKNDIAKKRQFEKLGQKDSEDAIEAQDKLDQHNKESN